MFQNIADAEITAGDAALFINSQLKAFNFTADESMHVIDSVNEVANNFAVGTNDLQLALSKTASAMGGFGNSFEQTIGIITAGTEIMVGQPSKVARGWRTIGANITKLAKQTDVFKDSSGKVEIQMRKSDGTMKNTYEFLEDLHKQWGNLNKEQQTAIALQMGGKNQMEVFMATMNNFDTAIEATNTAMDAQGSAARENGRYLESLQGHLSNLKSAWEEFSYKIVNSEWLKKGIDVLATALHFLSSDIGQLVVKGALLGGAFKLLYNGMKVLPFAKFSKGALESASALEIMQAAQVGSIKKGKALFGVFGRLTGSLLGVGGLVAGIGLLSVALAKYVDIGDELQTNKADKQFKKTKNEVDDLTDRLAKNRKEWSKLREKERSGEKLTEAEEARLRQLEAETEELKRQLRLKKALLSEEAKEKWTTKSGSQLKGSAKDKYIKSRSMGQSESQALAGLGLSKSSNRLDVYLVNYAEAAREATKAENEYRAAREKTDKVAKEYGKNSDEYLEAAKKETGAFEKKEKAEKDSAKSLEKLKAQRDQMYEDFGGKELFDENAPKTLKKSRDQLDKLIKAGEQVSKLKDGVGDVTKTFKQLDKASKKSGNNFLKVSKDGKKIEKINVNKLVDSMSEVGVGAKDTLEYLKEFSKANPKAKITLDGEEVAIKDLELVDGKIQKVDKEKAEPEIDADTKSADDKIKQTGEHIEELSGQKTSIKVGAQATKSGGLTQLSNSIKNLKGKNVKVGAKTSGKKSVDSLNTSIKNLKDKTVKITVKTIKKTIPEAHGVRHFAGGGRIANAEVNEQGFEIIQDGKTGMMRVVNGGKRGTTLLGDGDSVFTHNQSIRMLRKAGMTEGGAIYGHGDKDFPLFGVRRLEGFAKGLTQKQYNKKYKAITKAYDKALEKLEYERDYYHWSDNEYMEAYTKLHDEYMAKLDALNKKKVRSGVKRKKSLGTQREREYNLEVSETEGENYKKGIESLIDDVIADESGLAQMLNAISEADEAQRITADEAAEYRKEAYKKNVEYNLKQFKNDKAHFAETLQLIEQYYADGKIAGEDYYDYLEELAEEQLDKEKDRLSERLDNTQNTYDLAKAYVQRQIDLLEKENEEQETQNELIELQNNLAKARNQRIRIYKEGEGFVYEQDTEAIKEATEALQSYQSTGNATTNPVLAQWQAVLDLFDDLEADYELKALENAVGSTVGALFGNLGTDTSAWSDWIKNNLSTTYGLQEILDTLDDLVDTDDILAYLDQNGQVSDAIIAAAIANNVLPETYAAAITQMAQGMSAGANTTASLATQSAIAGITSGAVVAGSATTYGNIYNFDNLVLPNVTNADEFIGALDNIDTISLQASTGRG